ncbi:GNAT family N-acetyltransferase [Streptomyces odontomachi]|uniref:GNAT family N-acetyltransferase n=1 Tax=Streptomyces odontomachi TaxID=2944940 RepID=UPI00210BADE3|nr:GNAT family N-acetyltransferase [Streptomyces sp. ODS25]
MDHVVRIVLPEEWPALRQLRLAALQDPAAPVAFLESYEDAAEQPDAFWMQRAFRGAAEDSGVRQFVAEAPDGGLSGSVTVIVEEPGAATPFGGQVQQRQAQVVGVYVRPEYRGGGLIEALLEAALEWSWTLRDVARVRLFVHERNARAEAAYRKAGFARTGVTSPMPGGSSGQEVEMVVERP